MRVILLGPPGAGKGTQAQFISSHFDIPKISTGDILRASVAAGTPLGKTVKSIMEEGKLVPDPIVIALVKERIAENDCNRGYLLDGFPRTREQADALRAEKIRIDYVIEIDVPEGEIISRMTGRRIHPASGRVYHVHYQPPRVPDRDDETGELLIQREDDTEETVRHRLRVYQEKTKPLVDYYKKWASDKNIDSMKPPVYRHVSGLGTVTEVRDRILQCLEGRNGHHSGHESQF